MSLQTLCQTPVTVVRLDEPSGANQTRDEAVVYVGRARIQPLTASEREALGQDMEMATTKAYLPGTADNIRHGDRMFVSGTKYHVRGNIDVDLLGRLTTLYLERER